jgi:hypothetical protein
LVKFLTGVIAILLTYINVKWLIDFFSSLPKGQIEGLKALSPVEIQKEPTPPKVEEVAPYDWDGEEYRNVVFLEECRKKALEKDNSATSKESSSRSSSEATY